MWRCTPAGSWAHQNTRRAVEYPLGQQASPSSWQTLVPDPAQTRGPTRHRHRLRHRLRLRPLLAQTQAVFAVSSLLAAVPAGQVDAQPVFHCDLIHLWECRRVRCDLVRLSGYCRVHGDACPYESRTVLTPGASFAYHGDYSARPGLLVVEAEVGAHTDGQTLERGGRGLSSEAGDQMKAAVPAGTGTRTAEGLLPDSGDDRGSLREEEVVASLRTVEGEGGTRLERKKAGAEECCWDNSPPAEMQGGTEAGHMEDADRTAVEVEQQPGDIGHTEVAVEVGSPRRMMGAADNLVVNTPEGK